MAIPSLYLLLPESNPTNPWMRDNGNIQDERAINDYLTELYKFFNHLSYEEYQGYYDSENVKNCLEHFDILSDYYPRPVTALLRSLLVGYENWRDSQLQSEEKDYKILHRPILDHTFCENAENGLLAIPIANAILNINAHTLGNNFEIEVAGVAIPVISLEHYKEIADWFAQHRSTTRNFRISSKHGENRTDIRYINGETVYPFRSSLARGLELLKTAIGTSGKEIFNLDGSNGFIVFKHEGNNPQNQYHGYHVGLTSREVPGPIRKILYERLQD
jgi:hypothetical protein